MKEEPTAATAVMSNISPDATTAALAKDVPLEKKDEKSTDDATPVGGPGGFPTTPADELDKTVSINPLPATDVTLPPVSLAPGEPLPASAKAGDINAGVTLDKESYEKSDRLPGLTDENTALPDISGTTIPESGLPMPAAAIAAATINTVTPESTTAALAADVPKEPKHVPIPDVVKESQDKAGASPEASAQPVEVAEKTAVEEELKEKVPEAPSTAEGTAGFGTEKSEKAGIAATAITAGGIALAAATAAKDAVFAKSEPAVTQASEATSDAAKQAATAAATAANDLPEGVKEQLPESAQAAIKEQAQQNVSQEVASNVPSEVKESVIEAAKSPEAAANAAAVEDKKEVENELLKEVKTVPAVDDTKTLDVKGGLKAAVDESQASAGASDVKIVDGPSTTAVTTKPEVDEGVKTHSLGVEGAVKATVDESQASTGASDVKIVDGPSTTAVTTKPAADEAAASSEATGVTTKPVSEAAAKEETKTETKPEEAKKETNGTAASEPKAAPSTPSKAESSTKPASTTPSTGNAASSEKKKKNRLSAFFGKIKQKVAHKD